MKVRLHHPRTGLPIEPLGFRRNGAPIWPILGASDDGGEGDGAPPADDGGEGDGGDGEGTPDPDGADQLGDPGKQALDRMKAQIKAERAKNRELAQKLAEATKPAEGETPDPEALIEQGRQKAAAEFAEKLLRTEVRAAAADKLNDPADAIRFLDLSEFEADADGNFDANEIADAIADLVASKPYLAKTAAEPPKRFPGSADNGAQSSDGRPRQLTKADLGRMTPDEIDKAFEEGRLADVLAGK